MQKTSQSLAKIPVAIVGGRGYSGHELNRIFKHHPHAEVVGNYNSDNISELQNGNFKTVFLATPAEVSINLAPSLLARGIDVIDLSGAFRLPQGNVSEAYKRWYALDHHATDWVAKAHYGLVPWATLASKTEARLISNPGCYASAVLMALLPLLKSNLIETETLVIDAKSGTTGAGKKAEEGLLFSEVDGECLPYKVGQHQHLPEITQWSALYTGVKIDPFFTTHLLACRRGIIAGLYARLRSGQTIDSVKNAFAAAYGSYELVSHGPVKDKALLQLKKVVGTPRTHISYEVVADKLYVFSTLDNLLKGAASQAVENFNLLNDLSATTGLMHLEALT